MPRHLTQCDLLNAVVHDVDKCPDHPIRQASQGSCLVAIQAARVGLASQPIAPTPDLPDPPHSPLPALGTSARCLAARLRETTLQDTGPASVAMAAANALLPPPPHAVRATGQEILAAWGEGQHVAVIGHFPFVETIRTRFARLWVLEKQPQAGDHHAQHAPRLLPQADVVGITATTLLNGTLADVLRYCRDDARIILMGPSTPFAPSLFDCGIDVLSGCQCPESAATMREVAKGRYFRQLPTTEPYSWMAPKQHDHMAQGTCCPINACSPDTP